MNISRTLKSLLQSLENMVFFGSVDLKTNPKTSCQEKYLRKSRFQQLYSFVVYSCGQVLQASSLSKYQLSYSTTNHSHSENYLVIQESKGGQSAKQSPSEETKSTYQKVLIASVKLSRAIASRFTTLRERANLVLYYFWENKRLRYGIIFLMILGPFMKYMYMFFPEDGFGDYLIYTTYFQVPNFIEYEGWYWYSVYVLLSVTGNTLSIMVTMIGVFFLFPRNYYPSYLVGVPFGYFLGTLVMQLFATSNESLMQNVGPTTIILSIAVAIVGFAVTDHLLFKDNHRKRASEARLVGLINMPGMTWDDKEDLLKKEAKRMMKEDNELFSKTG